MADTPDWRALVLASLTNGRWSSDPVDVEDQDAWMLAYATLNARHGEVDPPEVLAELVERVNGIDRSLDTIVATNSVVNGFIVDRFERIEQAMKKGSDARKVPRRPTAPPAATDE